ncbi:MAG: hypothetical protein LCH85_09410 [Chloroflexi bacterium]|nr:hypothetical protein [Chloroflexota bacterium]
MTVGSLWLVAPEDFWWQLKIGDLIRTSGSIPTVGVFSATQANTAFFYQNWLSQFLFSWIYQLGGLVAILQIRSLLLIGSYALLLWHTWRRVKANGRAAMLGLLLSVLVSFNHWHVQPAMFAWPLFIASFVIVSEVAAERWATKYLWLLPLIQLLWVNLHESFIFGPILVATAAVGAIIDRRRDHDEAPIFATARSLQIATATTTIASFLNPYGWNGWIAAWQQLTSTVPEALKTQSGSPLSNLATPSAQIGVAVSLIAIIMLSVVWQRMRSGDLIITTIMAAFSLLSMRYQFWFGSVAGPIIAEAIVRRGRLRLIKRNPSAPVWIAGLTITIGLIGLLMQPVIRIWLPLPAALQGATGNLPQAALASAATPIQAVEFLQANPPSQAYFHDLGYGSYLIWQAGEQLPVFIDPRVNLYPTEHWQAYSCIMAGRDWERLLAQASVDTILVDRENGQQLISAVQANSAWREVYADQQSLIFKRDPQATQPINSAISCPVTN